jgi:pyruvate/2-oxoglutarate dehydrogenase complex dihydrolipoamide dehydrogenase (E3) component
MTNQQFDVIVLGAGPAGENAADIAARHGLSTAIVERELVGGECSYWACMPSKGLLRPGDIQDSAGRAPGFVGGEIDVEEALGRRNALAGNWDDQDQVDWLEGAGVTLVRGHGRIAGERVVEVELDDGSIDRLEATRAVIVATGTSASMPPISGLDSVDPWDSRDVTTAKEVPRRLAIIGGGVVGVEMAQAWKTLGAEEVTIIELYDRLLAVEEPFVGAELEKSFERMGIRVLTKASTKSVQRDGTDGPVTLEVTLDDDSTVTIEADELLVATGRKPNTSDIGLSTVGLEDGKYVDVDDHLVATDVEGDWLYAVGDVNARSLLTHTGKYQARVAGAHIAGVATSAWGDRKATPRVVFTNPQIAAVGLTESKARDAGIEVRTVSYDIGSTAGAATLGKGYHGTCQLIVDAERGVLVGATFVGPMTGELLHSATVAIIGEVPIDTLWHAIPSFPTLSEVWLRLLEAYRDEFGHEFL